MAFELGLDLSLIGHRKVDPFCDFTLALNFKNGQYRSSTNYSSVLSAMPGYVFTDNVDNLPNITSATGYTSLTAELSHLLLNASGLGSGDQLLWVTGTPSSVTSAANRNLIEISASAGEANNRIGCYVDTVGQILGLMVAAGVVQMNNLAGGTVVSAATRFTAIMKRLSGAWIPGSYKSGTLAWGASAAFHPTGLDRIHIGEFAAGGQQPDFPIEGVYLRTGTFPDDASVIAAISAV